MEASILDETIVIGASNLKTGPILRGSITRLAWGFWLVLCCRHTFAMCHQTDPVLMADARAVTSRESAYRHMLASQAFNSAGEHPVPFR